MTPGETRRLHPAAVPIYSAEALRNAAFPLLILVGVTLFGGPLDTGALMRALVYGAIGVAVTVTMGVIRWQTTSYTIGPDAIHHHSGILATKDTDIPLARLEALDVHQGPLQRLFSVHAVDVQTGAAGKGGEISLPALTLEAVEELRAARPQAAFRVEEAPTGPRRRISGRALALAALTAGQLGIILPVLAVAGQFAQQFADREHGEEAIRLLPHSAGTWVAGAGGVLVLAWMLSTLGAIVTFAGFTVTRDGDRLRIRRGFVSRSEATVPVARIRAVRVVEGIFRRPLGLATLQVEVLGYAEEASASRTLFPLVSVGEVRAFLAEFLPELEDDPLELARPPRRAARRYFLAPVAAGAVVTAASVYFIGPFSLLALAAGALYGRARWRSAGWHLTAGRLAVREMRLARTTILAPAALRESHSLAQTPFQRRAELADLEVAFGKQTTARIRHLELTTAHEAWAALSWSRGGRGQRRAPTAPGGEAADRPRGERGAAAASGARQQRQVGERWTGRAAIIERQRATRLGAMVSNSG